MPGLYVVEEASDFRSVEAQLAQIEPALFLSWEIECGQRVYRVLYERGDQTPAEIARWPYPLSSGLIELVKSLRPREGPDLERAQRENAARAERERADFEETVDEIAADVGPRISGKRSAALHRGQHLRLARSRTGHHDDLSKR